MANTSLQKGHPGMASGPRYYEDPEVVMGPEGPLSRAMSPSIAPHPPSLASWALLLRGEATSTKTCCGEDMLPTHLSCHRDGCVLGFGPPLCSQGKSLPLPRFALKPQTNLCLPRAGPPRSPPPLLRGPQATAQRRCHHHTPSERSDRKAWRTTSFIS